MLYEKDWFTMQELADLIHVSRMTIWTWIRDGKLKSTKYGSRHRITENDWKTCLATFNRK